MPFSFSVTQAGYLPSAKVYYLEGNMKAGAVKGGETAMVEGRPNHRITIRSVAMVCGKADDRITLSIDPPDFSITDLIGTTVVDSR